MIHGWNNGHLIFFHYSYVNDILDLNIIDMLCMEITLPKNNHFKIQGNKINAKYHTWHSDMDTEF